MENLRTQRTGLWVGAISVLLIVVVTIIFASRDRVHPMTPRDLKATISGSFTSGPPPSSGAPATGGAPAPAP